jgi:hypothetical protein
MANAQSNIAGHSILTHDVLLNCDRSRVTTRMMARAMGRVKNSSWLATPADAEGAAPRDFAIDR